MFALILDKISQLFFGGTLDELDEGGWWDDDEFFEL